MAEITAHHGLFQDTKLHVDDHGGGGRPVLLIHGWPLTGESWNGQVQAFGDAGYRVITYDRRGFGRSDKPHSGYSYSSLTKDLHSLITELDLQDVTLVGFSMGGGEVALYASRFKNERVHSVVFASSVTPYLLKTADNPDGALDPELIEQAAADLADDPDAFYDSFVTDFFSVGDELKVSEADRQEALAQARQADKHAALECMAAFAHTDFREEMLDVKVPALVIHGDGDKTVPFKGTGSLTHAYIPSSELVVLKDAPHGCTVSHRDEWNAAVLDFLGR